MRQLSASELLSVWESSLHLPLLKRSLHLLTVACSLPDEGKAARMSIGERDARLLQLRERLFGHQLKNMAHCPNCHETVEWESDTADFHLQGTRSPDGEPQFFDLDTGGYKVRFRLPNSEDLLLAMNDSGYSSQPRKLLEECIVEVSNEEAVTKNVEELPPEIFEILGRQMEQHDPQANIVFQMNCPACQQSWTSTFDIQNYLWTEIESWAKHTLQEVYMLARAFGWSEHDILAMHPLRRQLYLEMIGV